MKAPSGTRLEATDQIVAKVEAVVRAVIPQKDLKIIVSNIGLTPGFSSILNPNSAPHTAVVQVALTDDRALSSFDYMDRVRARLQKDVPEVATYFQTGGLVDAVISQGVPAPRSTFKSAAWTRACGPRHLPPADRGQNPRPCPEC